MTSANIDRVEVEFRAIILSIARFYSLNYRLFMATGSTVDGRDIID
jgi:hypothetical protein